MVAVFIVSKYEDCNQKERKCMNDTFRQEQKRFSESKIANYENALPIWLFSIVFFLK